MLRSGCPFVLQWTCFWRSLSHSAKSPRVYIDPQLLSIDDNAVLIILVL